MAILRIYKYPDPILRKKTKEIINVNEQIRKLVNDMADTMYSASGVGLAAPQVGISKRIIVVDVSNEEEKEKKRESLLVFINPTITKGEGEIIISEGCLSVPELNVEIQRKEVVYVESLNIKGEVKRIRAEGLLAVVIQHEIDHLNGILIYDHTDGPEKKEYDNKIKINKKTVVI